MDDFLIRAGLAGLGVALAAGPLGAFIIWRRMAYFGDATAHGAVLGVALALAADWPIVMGTVIASLLIAVLVSALAARGQTMDTSLGVLSHAALALGLVAVSLFGGPRVALESYLFGDILAVTWGDLTVIWGGAAVVCGLILWRWQALLTATLSEELAQSAGINPRREQLVLTLAMALVVAVSLKVVGALLIGAMLIIPAAAARALARSPEAMVALAVVLGAVSVGLGLWAAWELDTPAGPSIVSAAALIYAASLLRP